MAGASSGVAKMCLLVFALFACLSVSAAGKKVFTVEVSGAELTFLTLNDAEVQLGTGFETALPPTFSGALAIPPTVTHDSTTYSVTRIGQGAFNGCSGIVEVQLPTTVVYVSSNAFYHCSGLKRVIVSDMAAWCRITFANVYANPLFYARRMYSEDGTQVTDLVVPDGVTAINSFSFVQGFFQTVAIPGSVKQVGNYAFYGCSSLVSAELGAGVERLNSYAFSGCASLKSVSLQEGLARLGGSAFFNCQALQEIVLPSTITYIGSACFKQCKALQRVDSHITNLFTLENEVFLSVSPACQLTVPTGTLTEYIDNKWNRSLFGGGIVEVGDVETNFCLENPVVKDFLDEVTYPSDDYSFTLITDYTTRQTDYRKDLPRPVRIEAPTTDEGEKMVLQTLKDGQPVRTDTFYVGQKGLDIWNLIPQTRYDYKLFLPTDSAGGAKELAQGTFTTQGRVRMLRIDNVRNFRDIGGWPLKGGRRVSYDKVFRSAELAREWKYIKPKGIRELIDVLHIGVELDFADTIYSSFSPVADLLEHVHGPEYQMDAYVGGVVWKYRELKNCFDKVLQSLREGKKVLIHCTEGADRAGTLAFLMEALLGVSESDMAKEYELTCFYLDGEGDWRRHRSVLLKDMVQYVKATFPAPTLNESIEQLMLSFGVTQKDIDDFRLLMTELPESARTADVNGDGVVDLNDVKQVMEKIAADNIK